jgi:regulator of protease activity HflC (stomatin/prohibitin superfamily)
MMLSQVGFVLIVVLLLLVNAVRILREWERGVVLRLGRYQAVRGPGLIFIIPLIEKMHRINTRVVNVDVPPQDIITKDNVTLKVNAVVFFRILSPKEAVVNVEEYFSATYQKAQTVLRNVLGQFELDELLSARDTINHRLQTILDSETDQWGIKVDSVEIKHVDLPQEMQRAMARQAEAERERRAKVIAAEGEFQASTRLAEAANIMGRHPMSLQLRFLQTLTEVAVENNSTIVFPIPIDLIKPLIDMAEGTLPSDNGGPPTTNADGGDAPAAVQEIAVASQEAEVSGAGDE